VLLDARAEAVAAAQGVARGPDFCLPHLTRSPEALAREVGRVVGVIVDEDDGVHAEPRERQRHVLPDAPAPEHLRAHRGRALDGSMRCRARACRVGCWWVRAPWQGAESAGALGHGS